MVHEKEVENLQTQLKRQISKQNEDSERKGQDWKQDIKIILNFDAHHNKFIWIMTKIESMLDAHLVLIRFAKHCIHLTLKN